MKQMLVWSLYPCLLILSPSFFPPVVFLSQRGGGQRKAWFCCQICQSRHPGPSHLSRGITYCCCCSCSQQRCLGNRATATELHGNSVPCVSPMELPLGGPVLRHYTQSRPRPHRQKLNYRPSRPQVLCRRIREVSVKMESERKVCVCVFEGERKTIEGGGTENEEM